MYFKVYSTEDYKRLTASIDKLKLAKKTGVVADKNKEARRRRDLDNQIQHKSVLLTKMTSTLGLAMSASTIVVMYVMRSFLPAVPVARFPFEPLSFLTNVTHLGLPGNNYYECSPIFLYLLTNMLVKPVLQRVAGVPTSQATSIIPSFLQPPEEE